MSISPNNPLKLAHVSRKVPTRAQKVRMLTNQLLVNHFRKTETSRLRDAKKKG